MKTQDHTPSLDYVESVLKMAIANEQDYDGRPLSFPLAEALGQMEHIRAVNADLLAALQHCLCYLEADSDDDQERKDHAEARAAIAKAQPGKEQVHK